jgi:3-oxoacyl-[acyl-carrier protein] reductase
MSPVRFERRTAVDAGLHLTKYNQPFGVLSHNGIRHLFDMNVMGVINATLRCRDSMRNRGGGVVLNISSMAGYLSATPYMRCRN